MSTLIRTKSGISNPASLTLTIGSVTTFVAGNLVIVSVRGITVAGDITSVTDDKGNTYTKAIGPFHNTDTTTADWMYYGIQIIGGATTITVTFDTSMVSGGYASEFNGAGPLDKTSTGQASSGTSGSVSAFSPASLGELIYAFLDNRNTTTSQTAGANYTLITGNGVTAAEYNPSSSASETAPVTWTNSVGWNQIAAAFFTTTTSTSSTSSSTSTSQSTSTSISSTSSSTSRSTTSTSSSTSSTSTSTTTLPSAVQYWPNTTIKYRTR